MTPRARGARRHPVQRILLGLFLVGALVVQGLYLANVIAWRAAPDRGWLMLSDTGPKVIAATRASGEEAGLRQGDRILAINGQAYETYSEMLELLDLRIGQVNVYRVERAGEVLEVSVPTRAFGLKSVFLQSGINWVVGLVFLAMGLLVFLMKPDHGQSWAFLILAALLGTLIPYSRPVHTYQPAELHHVFIAAAFLIPGSLIHLTVFFPLRRTYFADRWGWVLLPYAIGAGLAVFAALQGDARDVTGWIQHARYLYALAGLLVFLGSTLSIYFRSRSVAARLQSLVIFTGTLIALLVPLTEQLFALFLEVHFFPDVVLFSVLCLAFFPLAIGYAIVRHDLFEIDVIVRRTYGYLLSTAAVMAFYAAVVSALDLTVGPSEIAGSPFFSVAFVLGTVFLLQPLQGRLQRVVDRAFYRRQYSYRRTITRISETMTTILDPEVVQRTLVGSVVNEMFLENGLLLVNENGRGAFEARVMEGSAWPDYKPRQVLLDRVLAKALLERKVGVFRHEIELAPEYEADREGMQASFDELGAELMLPMVYKDEVRAVLSLGRKKSGKMFTREDIDLLRTMINQSITALENARLFEEVAQSLKEIHVLETIKGNLEKFVPQTVQTMIEQAPDAEGIFDKREADLSVVFADMTGYTGLTSRLPVEEVNHIVERYFGAFLDEILRHGGDVNETAGDGLMVLFQDEDPCRHAQAAVRAALAIQRRTRELNAERASSIPIAMHIGVNSGVASVGATKIQGGVGMRWTYTASGLTTNIAARVAALGHEIAVTEETRKRLGDAFEAEETGLQSLKNVPHPVVVYRVTGARAGPC